MKSFSTLKEYREAVWELVKVTYPDLDLDAYAASLALWFGNYDPPDVVSAKIEGEWREALNGGWEWDREKKKWVTNSIA